MISLLAPLLLFLGPATQSPSGELRELLSRDRPALGTATARAADSLALALPARGIPVSLEVRRETSTLELALPVRGRLQVRDDRGKHVLNRAWAWDPEQRPRSPWPAVGLGPAAVHAPASGLLSDVGRGSVADLERLRGGSVDISGTIAICEREPGAESEQVRRLAEAGCVAVLFPPTGRRERAAPISLRGAGPFVPVFGLHRAEAEHLRAGLLARRLTGEDGRRRSYRCGPGPLAADLEAEARAAQVEASSVLVLPRGEAPTELLVAALDGPAAPIEELLSMARGGLTPGQGLAFFDASLLGQAAASAWLGVAAEEQRAPERWTELVLPAGSRQAVPASSTRDGELSGLLRESWLVGPSGELVRADGEPTGSR